MLAGYLFLDGWFALAGYALVRRVRRTRPMPDQSLTLSESAQQSIAHLAAADEALARSQAQLRLTATIILGLVLVLSTGGIIVLSFLRLDIPPALSAVGGTAIGALVASLNNNPKR